MIRTAVSGSAAVDEHSADRYELRCEQPLGPCVRERYFFVHMAVQAAKMLFQRHRVTKVQVIRLSDGVVIYDPHAGVDLLP